MAADGKPSMRNRNVKCKGRSVIRDLKNIPILGPDNERQYKPCESYGANGTDFCGKHGGQLEPTIAAAKRRLLHGADELVEVLKRLALDESQAAADRVRAINSYLDRAGIRAGMDVSVDVPKWQNVLGKMFGNEDTEDEPAEVSASVEVSVVAPKPPRKASRPKASAKAPERPKFEGW